MPYLVLKGDGFWRRRSALVVRHVRRVRLFGLRKTFRSERYIRKDRVLVLEGEANTGKTRELKKLAENAELVYGRKGVYISCIEGLENWFKRVGLSAELKGLKQFEKISKLVESVRDKVVCLDDVDRVDSKLKVQVIKLLVRASAVAVVSCSNIKRVNPSVVEELRSKLKLRAWEELRTVDLGRTEIRDIGMFVAIGLVVLLAFTWGITQSLILALALRWLVMEGRMDLRKK